MTDRINRVTAFAPATVGNAAVGFDILGFAVDAVGDRVTVERGEPGVRITAIEGLPVELPWIAEENTATVGLLRLLEQRDVDFGFDVTIDKGIPLGSGMGGSAASAVAGVVAGNALLDDPLSDDELLPLALAGEAVASGAEHADNAAPCLFGGLTLVRDHGRDVLPLPVPEGLVCVLVHPDHRVDTRMAREVLPDELPLSTFVEQSANLASFVAGCYLGDAERFASSCKDLLVEPFRSGLVPGFDAARDAAIEAGALAFSLSGSGPTVFALARDERDVVIAVETAIVEAFAGVGLASQAWTGPIEPRGARIEEQL